MKNKGERSLRVSSYSRWSATSESQPMLRKSCWKRSSRWSKDLCSSRVRRSITSAKASTSANALWAAPSTSTLKNDTNDSCPTKAPSTSWFRIQQLSFRACTRARRASKRSKPAYGLTKPRVQAEGAPLSGEKRPLACG